MSKIDFNALRDRAYKCACDHGFHDTDLSNEHLLMLVITELSEAVEADRKGLYARRKFFEDWIILMDDPKTKDEEFIYAFKSNIKDTVEDELSDVCTACWISQDR